MKTGPPPLRFLVLVVGGWAFMRATTLVPEWQAKSLVSPEEVETLVPIEIGLPSFDAYPLTPSQRTASKQKPAVTPLRQPVLLRHVPLQQEVGLAPLAERSLPDRQARQLSAPVDSSADLAPYEPLPHLRQEGRWSGSAWAFVRRGGDSQLATAGVLGGSQLGARFSYRLNDDADRPIALSARFYAPLSSLRGSEAAVGISWKPAAAWPVELLLERRQALGPGGRSAFSLLAYGGVSERPVLGPIRLDGYVQAGLVGLRSRDMFADGSLRLTVPLNRAGDVKVGAGLWGAAQPGLSRLDVGPHLSVRLPVVSAGTRLVAEWRVRVAGNAAPASGPALTLATDF